MPKTKLLELSWTSAFKSCESNYNRGYKEALEKAFPNGDYPQYVNYPPREVKGNVIKTPEFDNKLEGLKDNTEVVDQLNEKIKQIKNEQ